MQRRQLRYYYVFSDAAESNDPGCGVRSFGERIFSADR